VSKTGKSSIIYLIGNSEFLWRTSNEEIGIWDYRCQVDKRWTW